MGHIGFIGLGMMGRPMASRLHAAGHDLIVHDATASATRAFTDAHAGVVEADGLPAFAACSAVVLMLPDSDAVEAVVLGRDGAPGLIGVSTRGAVLIDMGSSQPLRSRALAERLQRAGLQFLDAPVSGGVKRAIDGTLAIMVGGDAAVLAEQHGLLAQMGRTITHVGAVGAGHAMKALNNYVSAAGLLATVEALHVGRRFGLDPAVMTDVLNSSTGKNNTTENKVKPFMLSGAFNSGFALALMCKDLGIAMSLGRAIESPMPLGDEVLSLWSEAAAELGKAADHTEMYRWLASRAG